MLPAPPVVEVRCRLGTEFGRALAPLVASTPGARAAVLTDAQGDAIDFAHDPAVEEIDVQLLGAQIGLTVLRLQASARKHLADHPAVLVEAGGGSFMAGPVAELYIIALMLAPRSNVGAAWPAFQQVRAELDQLLS